MILLVTIEKWEDIEGYEGLYQVSNLGEVKSISRFRNNGSGGYVTKDKILKQSKTTTGYWKVELSNNKKRKSLRVHRLVAKAFILNPENKPNINHIDGNPLNNHVHNLEWCTQQENILHAVKTGLKHKFYISKEDLHQLYTVEKKSAKQIGDMYGISNTTVLDRLQEYNIEVRSISEANNKYNLTDEFILSELNYKTQSQLSKEIGCDASLISHYLKTIKLKGECCYE